MQKAFGNSCNIHNFEILASLYLFHNPKNSHAGFSRHYNRRLLTTYRLIAISNSSLRLENTLRLVETDTTRCFVLQRQAMKTFCHDFPPEFLYPHVPSLGSRVYMVSPRRPPASLSPSRPRFIIFRVISIHLLLTKTLPCASVRSEPP